MSKEKKLKKKMKSDDIAIPSESSLTNIANTIAADFCCPVYEIKKELGDPKCIEIVCIIPQEQFKLRYGSVEEFDNSFRLGQSSDVYWAWAIACLSNSIVASKRLECFVQVQIYPEHFCPPFLSIDRLDQMPDNYNQLFPIVLTD